MRIYIVRHSVPDDGLDENGNRPDDAALTDEGRDAARALADWMIDKDEVPNSVWASPTARTLETAQILFDAFGLPGDVNIKGSMGPSMSIKKLVTKLAQDNSVTRPLIVSHHESIEHGLRVLDREPFVHLDVMAMCELRIVRVKRKSVKWEEHRRVLPSELGGWDHY